VANIDGTAKKKLVGGGAPMLSPDGARIAFDSTARSAYENAARGADDPKRQITVLDIASGKITILKDIPSDQCLDPVWSPDGKWIAFQSRRGSPAWISDLAEVKEDGTGFNIIKKGEEPLKSAFNRPCWARDGRSIFYHDLSNIIDSAWMASCLANGRSTRSFRLTT
jgi:TolB protein